MRTAVAFTAAAVSAAFLLTGSALAADARLVRVGTFDQPVYVTAPRGDSRLFVVERTGRIELVRGGRVSARPFADLRRLVGIRSRSVGVDQGGLLSLAFAPDYAQSGRLYVIYTSRKNTIRIDELHRSAASPQRVDPRSRRTLLSVARTSLVDIGGHLAFGPDRMLYVALGYTTRPTLPQDLGSLRGKILRIDPRHHPRHYYEIPPGNPFVGRPGARPEIWAYGLRNPWRFSFDRQTGDLVIGDVGDQTEEEIDYVPAGQGAGANFGYPIFEGRRRMRPGSRAGLTFPVLIRPHRSRFNPCAVIGGYVVRDRSVPRLFGRYVYGDLCTGPIRSLRLALPNARDDRSAGVRVPLLASFGEDGRGRVYAVGVGGPVYRLARPR
jgi:glucose/arabinose dehydrogenase